MGLFRRIHHCLKRGARQYHFESWNYRARNLVKGVACAIAIASTTLCGADNATVRIIEQVDSDPELARSLGQDRLSKYLVLAPDSGDRMNRINKSFLAEAVNTSLDEPDVCDVIKKDFSRGDVKLRDAMAAAFSSMGLSTEEASRLVLVWATSGATPQIKKILRDMASSPEALAKLADYHLLTSDLWIRSLEGMRKIVEGQSPIEPRVLISSLVYSGAFSELNAQKASESLQRGALEARWFLALGVERIYSGHSTMARVLSQTEIPPRTWAKIVWMHVARKIASDSTLTSEYSHRLLHAAPLYDEMRALVAESIATNGSHFITGYLTAASIPLSREEALIKDEANFKDFKIEATSPAVSEMIRRLPKKIRENTDVTNHLLWYLSRSGEATTLAIRKAVRPVLEDNPDLCGTLLELRVPAAEPYEHAISQAGAYQFEKKKKSPEDTKSATLLHYARKVGQVIGNDPDAWNSMVSSKDERMNLYLKELVVGTTFSDSTVSFAWLHAILREDPHLREKFKDYLIAQKYMPNEKFYSQWLLNVKAAIQTGDDLGNDDAANYKGWLADFFRTKDGWHAAMQRLETESILVPERLRNSMAVTLLDNPKRMWRIYEIATSSYGAARESLVNAVGDFVRENSLGRMVLDRLASGNKKAVDASGPLWPYVLSPSQPVIRRFKEAAAKGKLTPDLEQLHLIAIASTLDDPKAWSVVRKDVATLYKLPPNKIDTEGKKQLIEQYGKKFSETVPVISRALDNVIFREAWRIRVLNTVRFLGETQSMARFVLVDEPSVQSWSKAADLCIQKDSGMVQDMMESLVLGGESDEWVDRVTQIQKNFVETILSDRLLFEQFIGSRNREFFNAFAMKMGQAAPVPVSPE